MNNELANRIESAGMTLAGSLLAVQPTVRLPAADELWSRGAWVHADVIDGGYGARPSITLDEIHTLAAAGGPLDVHLMVDDVAGWLTALPSHIARITIQSERLQAGIPGLIELARQHARQVWIGVDTDVAPVPSAVADADGVLHMLVPPGAAGHSLDPSRLAAIRAGARAQVGVDGGVQTSHIDAVARSGVNYVVAGRSLFSEAAVREVNTR